LLQKGGTKFYTDQDPDPVLFQRSDPDPTKIIEVRNNDKKNVIPLYRYRYCHTGTGNLHVTKRHKFEYRLVVPVYSG
jgi:hypothetical protein